MPNHPCVCFVCGVCVCVRSAMSSSRNDIATNSMAKITSSMARAPHKCDCIETIEPSSSSQMQQTRTQTDRQTQSGDSETATQSQNERTKRLYTFSIVNQELKIHRRHTQKISKNKKLFGTFFLNWFHSFLCMTNTLVAYGRTLVYTLYTISSKIEKIYESNRMHANEIRDSASVCKRPNTYVEMAIGTRCGCGTGVFVQRVYCGHFTV